MADAKISALTALTAPHPLDEIPIVDKSDTTMAASGTTKRIVTTNLLAPNLGYLSGRYYGDPRWYGATSGLGSWSMENLSRTWWVPITIPAGGSIDRLGANVSGAGDGGCVLRFGIWSYPATSGGTVSLVLDAGTASCSTGGEKTVSFTAQPVHRHLVSVTAQGGSTVPSLYGINLNANHCPVYGAGGPSISHEGIPSVTGHSGALPSTATPTLFAGINRWPVLFWRMA